MKPIMKHSSLPARLFLFFFTFIFGFLVGLLLGMELFGSDMTLEVNAYKWIQLLQSACMFLLPPLLFASMCDEKPLGYLGLRTGIGWKPALLLVVAMLLAVPCINLLSWLNGQVHFPDFLSEKEAYLRLLEEQAGRQTDFLLNTCSQGDMWFNLLVMALMPALSEELFFRATLQRLLGEAVRHTWAIWLTAFVFSAVHMQFFNFVPRLLLGAFFGYLLVWSGSLWLPVLAHFVNNAAVVVYRHLLSTHPGLPDIDAMGTGSTWWVGALSMAVFAVIALCLQHHFVKAKTI